MENNGFESLLHALEGVNAAAVHLVPGRAPCMRVQRRIVELDGDVVTAEQVDDLVRDLLFSDHRQALTATGQVEVLYMARDGRRYRAAFTECAGARTMTLRPLPTEVPTLESLELPAQIAGFTRHRTGLVIAAGFFGSGKTTTFAAIVDALNGDPTRHIMTIEDTIEFVHQPGHALLHQQEIGAHVSTAVAGVRQAVAAGADTIVVSKITDLATFEAVLDAVESGCLVFCGVEAGSVVGALTEVVLQAPIEDRARLRTRIARALRGVTAQYLLPRAHRSGRVAVVEILVASPGTRAAIRAGKFQELPQIMHRCRGLGMQTAEAALHALQASHLVSDEDAQLYLPQRDGRAVALTGPGVR
ncbi:MAG: ATPase, T2SS/T4P/T4SS family [bacterium]|nr:ATPase, T2SS/T4P/T4SS family [bacterium]